MISENRSINGGYHHWVSTMSASRIPTIPDFVVWRRQLESVRNDIEDIFGVQYAALGAQKGYVLGNPFGYRSRHTSWITNRYLLIGIY